MGKGAEQDLSSFMSILIMTIGALTILLAANTLIIASNPNNLQITTLFNVDPTLDGDEVTPMYRNKDKEPTYIDVEREKITIYTNLYMVSAADLENERNQFSKLLNEIEAERDDRYIILVLRPGAARLSRKMRALMQARKIDVGLELYDLDTKIFLKEAKKGGAAEDEPAAESPQEDPSGPGSPEEPGAPPAEEPTPPEGTPTAPEDTPAPAEQP